MENDYLTDVRKHLFDLQDLVNEVLALREENRSLKELVKEYQDFMNRQLENNSQIASSILKGLIDAEKEEENGN